MVPRRETKEWLEIGRAMKIRRLSIKFTQRRAAKIQWERFLTEKWHKSQMHVHDDERVTKEIEIDLMSKARKQDKGGGCLISGQS
jgi:hypothetical protein